MRKIIVVIVGAFALTTSRLAFAQMPDKGNEMMGDKKEMMEGKGSMMGGKGMMGMMKMCQPMMNKPSMVAVGDGVVVLSGKKLYKYDANLNLVKEADVKVEDMGMMGQGMGKMDQGMGKMDMDGDDDKGSDAATKPVEDHAAHH